MGPPSPRRRTIVVVICVAAVACGLALGARGFIDELDRMACRYGEGRENPYGEWAGLDLADVRQRARERGLAVEVSLVEPADHPPRAVIDATRCRGPDGTVTVRIASTGP